MKIHKLITGSWFAALASAVIFISSEPACFAASDTWSGNGGAGANASWSNSSNWSAIPGATSGTANTDTAYFTLATPTYGTSANPVIIDSGRNLGSITFDLNAAAYVVGSTGGNALKLTAGGTLSNASTLISGNLETINAPLTLEGSYTIANNSGNPGSALQIGGSITNAAASTLTLGGTNTSANNIVSGAITSGTGALAISKTGAGDWDVTGTNTGFTGTTTISNGQLNINNASALGSGQINLSGGTFAADAAVSLANNINVTTQGGSTTAIFADIGGSNSIATSGNLIFNGTNSSPGIFVNNLAAGTAFSVTGNTYLANNTSTVSTDILTGTGSTSLGDIYGGPIGNGSIASTLTYYGSGTLTLNGTTNVVGAGENLLGGTVYLNYNPATETDSGARLVSGSGLFLGSNLVLSGGTNNVETVNGLTVASNSGAGYQASISASSGSGNIINLGSLYGADNGVINFAPGVATTTSASGAPGSSPVGSGSAGIFGGWALVGNGTTEDFATVLTATTGTATTIQAYPNNYYSQVSAGTGGTGIDELSNAGGQTVSNTAIGSISALKIDSSNSSTAGSLVFARTTVTNWYGSTSILYTGGANYTISGNPFLQNYSQDPYGDTGYIYLEQYGTGTLTINNVIYGEETFTSSSNVVTAIAGGVSGILVKGGPGTLILTANNNYGASTFIDAGTLSISKDSNIGGFSGTLSVLTATTGSTTVTIDATTVPASLALPGASLLGSTIKTVTAPSGGVVTITLNSGANATVTTPTTYAYANGQQILDINGTLDVTSTMTLDETATAATGTVTNYRPVSIGVNGATVEVDGNAALTVPGVVSPAGGTGITSDVSLTKTGTGTLVLSGANTYDGGTYVNQGTLLANTANAASTSSTGNGNVVVASGATLGGNGVIAPNGITTSNPGYVPGAAVTIQGGGTLAPGGVQTVSTAPNGNLTLSANATYSPVVLNLVSGATLKFALGTNLGANASSELVLSINLPGEVVFNNNVISINDLTSGNLSGTYVLFAPTTANTTGSDYTGLTLGANNVITGGLSLASSFTNVSPLYGNSVLYLDSATGDIDIAVPEPKTFALLLIGVAVLFHQRRKFRNQA